MKTRILVLAVTLVVMVASVFFVSGRQVEAQVQSPALSVLAVNNLFSALNAGNTDSAVASFSHGATASVEYKAGRQMYLAPAEIAGMLESWRKDGRQYDILRDKVTNVTIGLDIVTSDVEISDRDVAWGRETIIAVVHDGKIQRLHATDIQLTPSQYW